VLSSLASSFDGKHIDAEKEIAGWVVAHPAKKQERMTHQSFGSGRLKAIRPLAGAQKVAPRPQAVNWLSGGR
jgi:hypothetical protein